MYELFLQPTPCTDCDKAEPCKSCGGKFCDKHEREHVYRKEVLLANQIASRLAANLRVTAGDITDGMENSSAMHCLMAAVAAGELLSLTRAYVDDDSFKGIVDFILKAVNKRHEEMNSVQKH